MSEQSSTAPNSRDTPGELLASVAALRRDMLPVMALARGEVVLDGMTLEQQKAANDVVAALSAARKRTIAAAMKEERTAAKGRARTPARSKPPLA